MAILNPEITYIHIISGQDIPIKNMADFRESFDDSDNIYMTCIGEEKFPDIIKDRLYYPILNANWDCRKRVVRYINYLTKNIQRIIGKERHALGEFTHIYKGMVWVSLPKDVVCYVLDYVKSHPEYMSDLGHTSIPEEFFFQTVLVNSVYKEHIICANLRYTDWSTRHGSMPAYLDESDYEKIINSDCFFARKISSKISRNLVLKLKGFLND